MTDFITIPKTYTKPVSRRGRWQFYASLGSIANAALWGFVLLYLKMAPLAYTSYSAIDVPGAETNTNINLPDVGQATYQDTSPYAFSSSQDPRENFKFIAQSQPVLKAAAARLQMSPKEFGKPRIEVLQNTTVMEIELKGSSPEEAQRKSLAFYKAFEARLDRLRAKEATRRDLGSQAALATSQRKLEVARNRLYDYKARADLSSDAQIKELVSSIEQMRKQRAEILAHQQQTSNSVSQLEADLNLSARQAADTFVLQTDKIFQQSLKEYSDASTALTVLSSQFLPDHPTVVAAQAKRDATRAALLNRSKLLWNRPVDEAVLEKFIHFSGNNTGTARENLVQQLVALQAERRGLQSQAQAISLQLAQLERRHKDLTRQESTLDALKRDLQLAEVVFSSTATKLDVGKSNGFGSYPLIQVTVEPTLPESASEPKKMYVLLGGAFGSVLLIVGVMLLWWSDRNQLE